MRGRCKLSQNAEITEGKVQESTDPGVEDTKSRNAGAVNTSGPEVPAWTGSSELVRSEIDGGKNNSGDPIGGISALSIELVFPSTADAQSYTVRCKVRPDLPTSFCCRQCISWGKAPPGSLIGPCIKG